MSSYDNQYGTSFSLQGLSTFQDANIKDKLAGNINELVKTLAATVSGTGKYAGDYAVYTGTVSGGSVKIEIK